MSKKKKILFQGEKEPIESNLFSSVASELGFSSHVDKGGSSEEDLEVKNLFTLRSLAGLSLSMRIEKKGRRGKTVTILSGFTLRDDELKYLSKVMKKALGCGASLEEGTIVLQGDNRDRIAKWLEKNGVKIKY